MTKPAQRVIVYRAGMREGASTKSMRINQQNAKYTGREDVCPRCKRKFRDASIKHMSDPPNKIPCLAPKVTGE